MASIKAVTGVPETHADLLDAPFGTLAMIDPHDQPQLTEVWFLHEEGELKVWLNTDRAKTRNLRERPQCSLLVLDLENPRRYLEVRGRAEDRARPRLRLRREARGEVRAGPERHRRPRGDAGDRDDRAEKVYAVDMSR